MTILRTHATLQDMLIKEVAGIINPRQAAGAILQKTQDAEALVLYKDKHEKWLVVPVGSAHPLRNVGAAAHRKMNGKKAVAVCYITQRKPSGAPPST